MNDLGWQDGDALGKGRVSLKMVSTQCWGPLVPFQPLSGLPGPYACRSKTSLLLPCLFPQHVPHVVFSGLSPLDGAWRFLLCQWTPEKQCPCPALPVAFLPISKTSRLLFQPPLWVPCLLLGLWLCQSLAWCCCYVLFLCLLLRLNCELLEIRDCIWFISVPLVPGALTGKCGGGVWVHNKYWLHSFYQPLVWCSWFSHYLSLFPVNRVLTELVSKMKDMQMDKSELGCLRAIVLFNPGDSVLLCPPPWSAPSALMFFGPLAQLRQRGEKAGPGDLSVGRTVTSAWPLLLEPSWKVSQTGMECTCWGSVGKVGDHRGLG